VNAQIALFLAFDRQDLDQPDQPFRVRKCLPALPLTVDSWETGGVEKLEKRGSGLTDPLGGNRAGGAGRGHAALLPAKDRASLPQTAPLTKFRNPSIRFSYKHSALIASTK
jgi:hypothetical protein